MDARTRVLLEYGGLYEGENSAGNICPVCEGGSTREGTLSVSRKDGALVWFCHRDSCQFKGRENTSGRGTAGLSRPVQTRGVWGRRIDAEAESLPLAVRSELETRYGITDRHVALHGLGWNPKWERIILPIKDLNGEVVGCTTRSLDKQASHKSLPYAEGDALSWYINHSATIPGVIIVEDQLSAIRASDYLCSVALLGTHLNETRAEEIRASAYRPCYLALDADAWRTAVKYAIEYRSTLSPQLVRLSKDIKNHTAEELSSLMEGI